MPLGAPPPPTASSSLSASCTAMISMISSLAALLGLRSARAALRACLAAASRGASPARLACECERCPCACPCPCPCPWPWPRACTFAELLLRLSPPPVEPAVLDERLMRVVTGGAAPAALLLPSEVRLRCEVEGAGAGPAVAAVGAAEVDATGGGAGAKAGGGGTGAVPALAEGDDAAGMARSHTTQKAPKSRSSILEVTTRVGGCRAVYGSAEGYRRALHAGTPCDRRDGDLPDRSTDSGQDAERGARAADWRAGGGGRVALRGDVGGL